MKIKFKRAGDIVARYGGEEFIIFMSDYSGDDAKKMLQQFQDELNQMKIRHKTSEVSEFVTVSVGLVNIVPTQDDSLSDAIKCADKALYKAKAAGRNQICIDESCNSNSPA